MAVEALLGEEVAPHIWPSCLSLQALSTVLFE
jgi:hypothetical protein